MGLWPDGPAKQFNLLLYRASWFLPRLSLCILREMHLHFLPRSKQIIFHLVRNSKCWCTSNLKCVTSVCSAACFKKWPWVSSPLHAATHLFELDPLACSHICFAFPWAFWAHFSPTSSLPLRKQIHTAHQVLKKKSYIDKEETLTFYNRQHLMLFEGEFTNFLVTLIGETKSPPF